MLFPDELRYHEAHTWVRIDGGNAVVGMTDYAQREMGDIIYLELPDEGDAVEQGEPFGTVESAKTVEDLVSPVTGEVVKVNKDLTDAPEGLNEDPYGDGWMLQIKMKDEGELARLMTAAEYERLAGELAEAEEEEEGFDLGNDEE